MNPHEHICEICQKNRSCGTVGDIYDSSFLMWVCSDCYHNTLKMKSLVEIAIDKRLSLELMPLHPHKMTVDCKLQSSDYDRIAYCIEICDGRSVAFGWRIENYAEWLVYYTTRYLMETEGTRDLNEIATFCNQTLYGPDKEWNKRIDDIYMVLSSLYFLRNWGKQ